MITIKISKRKFFYIIGTLAIVASTLLSSFGVSAVPEAKNASSFENLSNVPTGTTYTLASLTSFAQADATYKNMTFDQWNLLIQQRGISHIDDNQLQQWLNTVADGINTANKQLGTLVLPNAVTLSNINSQVASLQTQRNALQATLDGVKANAVSSKKTLAQQQNDPNIQQAANNVAAVDGQINTVSQPLQIQSQVTELNRWIASTYQDFACGIEEQILRSQGKVTRVYYHSVYYMDFTANSGTITSGVTGITFTNASAAVVSVTALFTTAGATKVVVGDYIRVSNGTEWYKVTVVAATTLTISPAFQQATVTDTTNATLISCPVAHDSRTAMDGSAYNLAWCNINQFTAATRVAGDILNVRGGQTNHMDGINVSLTSSGTVTSYIEIRGWTAATQSGLANPWGDGTTAQPIFNFGNTAFQVAISKTCWRIYNLEVTNINVANGGIIDCSFATGANYSTVDTCTVHLNTNASGVGIRTSGSGLNVTITACSLYDNTSKNISIVSMDYVNISNCTLNGGSATTAYGISATTNIAKIFVTNTTFGVTTNHSTESIYTDIGNSFSLRNCNLADVTQQGNGGYSSFALTSEDDGQVLGASKAWYYSGTITASTATGTVRTGGGTSSALMLPASVATIKYPLNLAYGLLNPDFAIYCPASPITFTVYAVPSADWYTSASYPSTYPDDNLIINSTFETNVTGWTASGGCAITRQTTQHKYDAASARVVRTTTDGYAQPTTNIGADPYQGQSITFSCWAWTATANTTRLALNDGTTVTYSSYCAGDSAWHLLTVTETINANATYIQPRLVVDTSNATAYFDAALLYPPLNTQLTLTADYYSNAVTPIRTTTAASTQHVWDNAEPARGSDGVFATYAADNDATTNTTTLKSASLTGGTTDYYKGWLLVNTTRNIGAMVTAYNSSTKTITCNTITGQTKNDTFYLLNWVALTVTCTPAQAGFVYLKLNLGLYLSATAGIYVDVKPTATY